MTTDAKNIAAIDSLPDDGGKQITRDYPMMIPGFGGGRYFANLNSPEGFIRDTRPDLIGFDTLDRMRRHAPIKAALTLIKMPILSRVRMAEAECEDADIQAVVQKELIDSGLLYKLAVSSLRALDFGVAFHEKRWVTKELHVEYETEDIETGERVQKTAWDGIAHTYKEIREVNPATITEILRRTVHRGYTGVEADESFDGFVQGMDQDGVKREVDPYCSFVYTYSKEYGNMWGEPRNRDAYPYYMWAQFVLKAWMMWVERKVVPPNKAWFPMGQSRMPDGSMIDNQIIALMMGKALNNSSTVALPSTNIAKDARGGTGRRIMRDWDIEEVSRTDVTEIFKTTKEELDNDMFRAMFAPPRTFDAGSGDGGLFSTDAQAHFDVFLSTEDGIILDFSDSSGDFMVTPFVNVNFGEDAPPCRIKIPGLSDEQRQMLEETFTALVANVNNQDRVDFDALATRFSVPLKDVTDTEEEEVTDEIGNPAYIPEVAGGPAGAPGAATATNPSNPANPPAQPATTGAGSTGANPTPSSGGSAAAAPARPNNLLLDDVSLVEVMLADFTESIELASAPFDPTKWIIEEKPDSPLGYKVTDAKDGRVLGGYAAMQVIKSWQQSAAKSGKSAATAEKASQHKAEAAAKHTATLAAQAQRKADAATKKAQTEQTAATKRAEAQAKRDAATAARVAKQAQTAAEHAAKVTAAAQTKQNKQVATTQAHTLKAQQTAQTHAAATVINSSVVTSHAQATTESKALAAQTATQNVATATALLKTAGWQATGQFVDKAAAIAQATQEALGNPTENITVVPVAGGFVVASKAANAAPAPASAKPTKAAKVPKPVKASDADASMLRLVGRGIRGLFGGD